MILSDHQNLTYFKKAQKLNSRRAQWLAELAEYDFTLNHVPGTKMICADALSWHPDYAVRIEDDNTNVVILPDHLFISLIDADLQDQLSSGLSLDNYAQKLIKDLEMDSPSTEHWTFLQNKEALALFFKGKQYVPADIELHCQILRMYHDSRTAGHPGILETFNAVSKYYY